MDKKTKEILKKVGAVAGVVAVVGMSAFAGSQIFPKTITETQTKIVTETVEVVKEVPVEVETIVQKEVIVEVPVQDTELSKVLCDRLLYEDMTECIKEVEAEDSALKMALAKFNDEKEIFDLLEDEGIISDEDKATIIKIYDDFEDIEVVESDYKNEKYEFKIIAKIEDKDANIKKKVEFTFHIEDGELEISEVSEI